MLSLILVLPVISYLIYMRVNNKAGTEKAMFITPLITSISLLMGIYGFNLNTSFGNFLIILFILFCLIGDIYNCIGEDHLLYGLVFFAVGHIFLIFVAVINFDTGTSISAFGLLVILCMFLLYNTFTLDGIMKQAVPIYILLATLSLIFAYGVSSTMFFIGVLLFVLSDVFLGLSLFHKEVSEKIHNLVWPLYGAGIYLIANSMKWNMF